MFIVGFVGIASARKCSFRVRVRVGFRFRVRVRVRV